MTVYVATANNPVTPVVSARREGSAFVRSDGDVVIGRALAYLGVSLDEISAPEAIGFHSLRYEPSRRFAAVHVKR